MNTEHFSEPGTPGWLILLAVVGGLALAMCAFRAGFALLVVTAEGVAQRGLADVSHRRGDITGMAERQAVLGRMKRGRLRAAARLALWLALLAVPPLLGLTLPVYSVCVLLWLLPRRPRKPADEEPVAL